MSLTFMQYVQMLIYVMAGFIFVAAMCPTKRDEIKLALADEDPEKLDTAEDKFVNYCRVAVIVLSFLFLSAKFDTTGEMIIKFVDHVFNQIAS